MLRFMITSSILLLLLVTYPLPTTTTDSFSSGTVYIVYMGAANPTSFGVKERVLNSLLQRRQEVDVLRTYSHGLSGFAARLSPKEAEFTAAQPGVVSVFPSSNLKLLTTRSWDFLQGLGKWNAIPLAAASKKPLSDSSNVVIGIFDTGIWPESDSFRYEGTNQSFPRGWKGICMTGKDFNETACNGKIVGARYYNFTDTPRDKDGHGTHVASTAAGVVVAKASFYDGLASGTARGGSESAKIAVYKVCEDRECPTWVLFAAFDEAIADGVHIISLSLGYDDSIDFLRDPVALGAFHAMESGITVVCAAGNSGPRPLSVINDAPWLVTVAASTVDRAFRSNILLGGGKVVEGEWIGLPDISRSPIYPLIDGRSAKEGNVSYRRARSCEPDSLNKKKVKGKIVICDVKDGGFGSEYGYQLGEVIKKGGIGIIVVKNVSLRVAEYEWEIPITGVGSREAAQLITYIKTTRRNSLATILPTVVVGNYTPAPEVAFFSGRGPSNSAADVIKPDITAPGVDILAAWTGDVLDDDKPKGRPRSSFYIDYGTSMSCPHVSGVAADIKAAHPAFTPSAIKSAIMTTAFSNNNLGSRITSHTGEEATPYDLGAGEVNPMGALNPGLVYDTSMTDYLMFMCYYGYDTSTIRWISKVARSSNFSCPRNSGSHLISNLNFPSISILLRGVKQARTVPRRLTNVAGDGNWTYKAVVEFGGAIRVPCVVVKVYPKRLSFMRNEETHSYKVKFISKAHYPMHQGPVYGWITWTNPRFKVRSPFVVRSN